MPGSGMVILWMLSTEKTKQKNNFRIGFCGQRFFWNAVSITALDTIQNLKQRFNSPNSNAPP